MIIHFIFLLHKLKEASLYRSISDKKPSFVANIDNHALIELIYCVFQICLPTVFFNYGPNIFAFAKYKTQ